MVWLVHCFLPFSFSHIVSPPFATKHSNLYLIWLVEPRERTPSEPHKESYSITTNTRITLYIRHAIDPRMAVPIPPMAMRLCSAQTTT